MFSERNKTLRPLACESTARQACLNANDLFGEDDDPVDACNLHEPNYFDLDSIPVH